MNVAKAGDAVLLSFAFCSKCKDCAVEHPAYCQQFEALNYPGEADIFLTENGPAPSGSFFGQSSFANFTIVKQTSVVNVTDMINSEDELKLFAPLGCGFQTGMGTMDNFASTGPSDSVVILGLGGVGLSAIAASHLTPSLQIYSVNDYIRRRR